MERKIYLLYSTNLKNITKYRSVYNIFTDQYKNIENRLKIPLTLYLCSIKVIYFQTGQSFKINIIFKVI